MGGAYMAAPAELLREKNSAMCCMRPIGVGWADWLGASWDGLQSEEYEHRADAMQDVFYGRNNHRNLTFFIRRLTMLFTAAGEDGVGCRMLRKRAIHTIVLV
jgi:hypothetical protein